MLDVNGGDGAIGQVYELDVRLLDIEPPIWRRLAIPADATLADLHRAIQTTLGWVDVHLHLFETPDGRRYETNDPDIDPDGPGSDVGDARAITLSEVLPEVASTLQYTYDFGDDWQHRVELTAIDDAREGERYPRCLAGERAGPPEDCGGSWGYEDLLEALADPAHERHEELVEWSSDWQGAAFDPEAFDVAETNAVLEATFWAEPNRS